MQRAAGSEAKDDMTEVMSDKDLLDALDPDQPGLESVCEAMSAADLGEAKQRLINYFRNRRDAGPPAILRARRFASASNCLSWQYFCISKSSTHSAEHFERMIGRAASSEGGLCPEGYIMLESEHLGTWRVWPGDSDNTILARYPLISDRLLLVNG
ncbi:MAG: heparinase II/III family protein [Candidatus Latescibacterota bacterium]